MSTDLTIADQAPPLSVVDPSAFLFDVQRMEALMRFAEMMACAVVTVPKHLHGKPADCMAIALQAMRWRMDPFVTASKTHVVNGNLGYEAQLVVAVLKNSGAIKGRPHYEFKGDGNALECRAGFIPAGEDAVVWTEWLSICAIKVKNSPLWATNPKQQFGYLQARNWARLYAPDALLGIYTDDEIDPSPPPARRMELAEIVPPPSIDEQLPAYPDDAFQKNLPAWRDLIESGKKTPDAVIATLSSRATLTDEQCDAIRAFQVRLTPVVDGVIDIPTTNGVQS
jgi:hypothetical protein